MSQKRKPLDIATAADYQELQKAYQFIPDENGGAEGKGKKHARTHAPAQAQTPSSSSFKINTVPTTWQERMAKQYHSHLYKSHVVADLSRYQTNQIGLRWRTKQEVMVGKGVDTCGNKHCPCYYTNSESDGTGQDVRRPVEEIIRWRHLVKNRTILSSYAVKNAPLPHSNPVVTSHDEEEEEEKKQLQLIPHGLGLFAYQVHFSYVEQGERKDELVKLILCLRCAPMVFWNKGGAMAARLTRNKSGSNEEASDDVEEKSSAALSDDTSDGGERREQKRRRKEKKDHRYERKHRKRKFATKSRASKTSKEDTQHLKEKKYER